MRWRGSNVLVTFSRMPRIRVSREELATTLYVWLAVAGIKQPWLIRDLWTRRGEQKDKDKQERARRALAEHLAGKFDEARHEVTREEPKGGGLFG